MIAVQGPKAAAMVESLLGAQALALRYYHALELPLAGFPGEPVAIVSRTGYTGEDGWELVVPARRALDVWRGCWRSAVRWGRRPPAWPRATRCGWRRRCRCTATNCRRRSIRFRPDSTLPFSSEERDFPGCEALEKARREPSRFIRVGWRLFGRRVPREHHQVLASDGASIGHVTSGTFSPTLEYPIAMGYCQPAFAKPGTEVFVDIRGRREPATVVELPFYRRGG